jgi:hypothetical protein
MHSASPHPGHLEYLAADEPRALARTRSAQVAFHLHLIFCWFALERGLFDSIRTLASSHACGREMKLFFEEFLKSL